MGEAKRKEQVLKHLGIKLAFRHEGDYVNCYFVDADEKEAPDLWGSMHKNIAKHLFDQWRDMMSGLLRDIITDKVGMVPEMIITHLDKQEKN